MALQKEIILENGITANYHLILNTHFIKQQNKTIVKIASYISKDFRDTLELYSLEVGSVRVITLRLVGECNREQAYETIKELTDWNGAEDI